MITPRKKSTTIIDNCGYYTPDNDIITPLKEDLDLSRISANQQQYLAQKEEERNRLKNYLVTISVRLHEAIEESALREKEIKALNQAKSAYQIKLCELNEEITCIRNSLSPLMNKSIAMNITTPGRKYRDKSYVDFSIFTDDMDETIANADFFDALFISPKKKFVTSPRDCMQSFEPQGEFQLTDLLPMRSKVEHLEVAKKRQSFTKSVILCEKENMTFAESVKLKLHPLGEIARYGMNGLNMKSRMRKSLSFGQSDRDKSGSDPVSLTVTLLLTSHMRLEWIVSKPKSRRKSLLDVTNHHIKEESLGSQHPEIHMRYEVQRSVLHADDDNIMEHCRVTFQTIGYTDSNNFITSVEDFPRSTIQFRVRGINLFDGKKGNWSAVTSIDTPDSFPTSTERYLPYEHMPFDNNGVLYWIGTSGGRTPYQNPQLSGEVGVETSCPWKDVKVDCYVQYHDSDGSSNLSGIDDYPCTWVSLDLGRTRQLLPTHYCLRGRLYESLILRSWELQARDTDTSEWICLRRHYNDTDVVYHDMHAVAAWPIEGVCKAYRYFRIRELDPVALSDPSSAMQFCGIELYGIIVDSERRHSLFFI